MLPLRVSCLLRSYLFLLFPPSLFCCSSLSLALPLSNSCHSCLLPIALQLSCLFVRSDLLPWCTLLSRADVGLTFDLLFLSLGFCCTPMWPPPPPTHYPNKEQHDCPAQWGQYTQKHTLTENMTCICANESVPEGSSSAQECQSVSHTIKASNTSLCSKSGRNTELLHRGKFEHTQTDIHFLTSCAVLFDPMSIVRSRQNDLKAYTGRLDIHPYTGLTHRHAHASTHFQLMYISLSVESVTAKNRGGRGTEGCTAWGEKWSQYKVNFILLSRPGLFIILGPRPQRCFIKSP